MKLNGVGVVKNAGVNLKPKEQLRGVKTFLTTLNYSRVPKIFVYFREFCLLKISLETLKNLVGFHSIRGEEYLEGGRRDRNVPTIYCGDTNMSLNKTDIFNISSSPP